MEAKQHSLVMVGDILTLGLVTVIGFFSHGTLDSAGNRLLATYLPLAVAWFLIAHPLGLIQIQHAIRLSNRWRLVLAVIFSVSLAAIVRSLWLGGTVAPTFALVMMATSLLGILAWRFIWEQFFRKR